MRSHEFIKNGLYEVSGSASSKLFLDEEDYTRFTFLIIHLQSPIRMYNVNWYTNNLKRKGSFRISDNKIDEILGDRNVELLCFHLLPDSYRLIVRNVSEGELSVYMHRILTGYSKYFNSKYGRRGHVFANTFNSMIVPDNKSLINTSANIYRASNPSLSKLAAYPWSSYQDYIGQNRWGELLEISRVLKNFKNALKYKQFIENWKPRV